MHVAGEGEGGRRYLLSARWRRCGAAQTSVEQVTSSETNPCWTGKFCTYLQVECIHYLHLYTCLHPQVKKAFGGQMPIIMVKRIRIVTNYIEWIKCRASGMTPRHSNINLACHQLLRLTGLWRTDEPVQKYSIPIISGLEDLVRC